MKNFIACFFLCSLCLLFPGISFSQVNVLTQHNDLNRTGANISETMLTTSNISPLTFGKLFEYPVTGQVYAQPLYVSGLTIPGKGSKNVLFIATMHNDVYALDADDASLANQPYWHTNLGVSVIMPDTGIGKNCGMYNDIKNEIGILSTPVIDPATNTIYLVAKTKENGIYIDRIHALDITTGIAKFGSPKTIQGTVPGTGAGQINGMINFLPVNENQRSSLLLLNGIVYVAYAGYCDTPPYHGWIFGYNAADIQEQKIIFNTTPNGDDGGIWMSGQGPSADANGDLYVITGNGRFNPSSNDYGDCFLRLRPSGGSLQVMDHFAPYNENYLNQQDLDLGSDGALLIPGTSLVTASGKEGILYLLKRNNLGKFNAAQDTCWQRFTAFTGHLHGSTVFWKDNNNIARTYWWSEGDQLKSFRINSTDRYDSIPDKKGPFAAPGMPGGMLSISSNGSAVGSGVLWVSIPISDDANHTTVDGMVHAFDAADISKELWNSQQIATRDALGKFAKFCSPTVVNGRVYLATFSDKVMVYGVIDPLKLRDPENPANTENGIDYKYYEGTWDRLPFFEIMQPVKTGKLDYINFSPAIVQDGFGFRYSGFLDIPSDGFYTFYLDSDNGSKFYVGDITLIDNNGLHAAQELSGRIGLKAGKHAITIDYFKKTGNQSLSLSYEGPGIGKQLIPASSLYRVKINPDQFVIRPDPAYSKIHLVTGNSINTGTVYKIYNNLGQLVLKGTTTGNDTEINVLVLSRGVYYLSIIKGGKKLTEKFLKL